MVRIAQRNMKEVQSAQYCSREDHSENDKVREHDINHSNSTAEFDVERTPESSTTAHEYTSTTSSGNAKAPVAGKMFVGGLPGTCRTEDLKQCFQKFGRIVDCVVMTMGTSKTRSRGFGFVTFEKPFAKINALKAYNHHFIHGKWVEVKQSIPKHQMKPSARIHDSTHDSNENAATPNSTNFAGMLAGQQPANFQVAGMNGTSLPYINTAEPRTIVSVREQTDVMLYTTCLTEDSQNAYIISHLTEANNASQRLAQRIDHLRSTMLNRKQEQDQRTQRAVLAVPYFPRCTASDWAFVNAHVADPFGDSPCATPRDSCSS